MASIYHFLSETEGVSRKPEFTETKFVATTEICKNNDSPSATEFEYQEIDELDIQRWLDQTNGYYTKLGANKKGKTVLRIIWIPLSTPGNEIDIDEDLFTEISTSFRHQSAYAYLKTQYSGIGSMKDQEISPKVWFLCNHPKLSVTWSRNAEVGVTSMICVADRDRLDKLQDMTKKQFLQNLAEQEMTPVLMSALLSSIITDLRNKDVKIQVEEVEKSTGHHARKSFLNDSANRLSDLVEASAKMSGCMGKTQASIRRVGMTKEFFAFICNYLEEKSNTETKNEILAVARVIEQRSTMQDFDLKDMLSRIQTQKDALFHLISAEHSETALEIARESRQITEKSSQIAKKSGEIASLARSDSQNMKFLAYVTMFYLPATFLSSLFSTPIFQQESSDSADATVVKVWMPGLKLYVPLALSLMIMTALACAIGYFWPKWKKWHSDRRKRGSGGVHLETGNLRNDQSNV